MSHTPGQSPQEDSPRPQDMQDAVEHRQAEGPMTQEAAASPAHASEDPSQEAAAPAEDAAGATHPEGAQTAEADGAEEVPAQAPEAGPSAVEVSAEDGADTTAGDQAGDAPGAERRQAGHGEIGDGEDRGETTGGGPSGSERAETTAGAEDAEEDTASAGTQVPGTANRAPQDPVTQDPESFEAGAADEAMAEAGADQEAGARGSSQTPAPPETPTASEGSAAAATSAAPTRPARRRLRTLRRRRPGAPLSWRRVAHRSAAVASALVLVAGAAGLTWWGRHSPAPMTPSSVEALTIAEQGARTVYVCPGQPGNTLAVTEKGTTTARTLITPVGRAQSIDYRGETLDSEGTTSLDAGTGGVLSIEPAGSQAVSAATVVTSLTNDGDLRGLTAAPCTQPSAVSWIVGGSADLGASADLRLDNPGVTAVTARVSLYGSSGRLSLPSNGEVTIPAGKSQSMLLETSGSQDERIAVSIEADGGSLVPTLVTESLDGETAAGVDVITPGSGPATDLTIPAVQVVDAAEQGETPQDSTGATSSEASAVRVVNPHEEPASVSITMLGPEGPTPLPGAQEVEIDPGAVFDLSLRGVAPGTYGVQVTADRQVAAGVRLVRSAGEYPARSGSLVHDEAWIQPGAGDSGPSSILAVPRGGGLTPAVALANSGDRRTVTLASLDGGWSQEVSLPAGGASTVEVPQDFSAVTVTDSGTGEGLAAATIVTAQATGDAAGTLISVVPAVPDAAASAQREVLLD
ncbi:DUF5719 family protein [Actinomyces capricornis]|uniref:Prevent-host-death protein n=1 Tax=Actinomyces capricornis TaxID=2755559 RepID=A0ABN6K282_9ACTO|nr:DUF5719 family protein [Actinomyces capricornis]BDA63665.1 hypothetical protein MANAM107_04990 [Actinomyces capricornis]